jgi:hypothetical protein
MLAGLGRFTAPPAFTASARAAAAPAMDVVSPHDLDVLGGDDAPAASRFRAPAPFGESAAYTPSLAAPVAASVGAVGASVGASVDRAFALASSPTSVGGSADFFAESFAVPPQPAYEPMTLRPALLLPQAQDLAASPEWSSTVGSFASAAAIASLPEHFTDERAYADAPTGALAASRAMHSLPDASVDDAGWAMDAGSPMAAWMPAATGATTAPLWSGLPGMTAERSRRWATHTQRTAADLSLDFVSPEMVLAARVYGLTPADAAQATRLATGGPTALQTLAGAVELTFLRALAGDAELRGDDRASVREQRRATAAAFDGGGSGSGAYTAAGFDAGPASSVAASAAATYASAAAAYAPAATGSFASASRLMPTTAYPVGDVSAFAPSAFAAASATAPTAASLSSAIPAAPKRAPRGAFLWPAGAVGALGMKATELGAGTALPIAALELLAAGAVAQLGTFAIAHGATAEESAELVAAARRGGFSFGGRAGAPGTTFAPGSFAPGASFAPGSFAPGAGFASAADAASASATFVAPSSPSLSEASESPGIAAAPFAATAGSSSEAGYAGAGGEEAEVFAAAASTVPAIQRARFQALFVALGQSASGREMSAVGRARARAGAERSRRRRGHDVGAGARRPRVVGHARHRGRLDQRRARRQPRRRLGGARRAEEPLDRRRPRRRRSPDLVGARAGDDRARRDDARSLGRGGGAGAAFATRSRAARATRAISRFPPDRRHPPGPRRTLGRAGRPQLLRDAAVRDRRVLVLVLSVVVFVFVVLGADDRAARAVGGAGGRRSAARGQLRRRRGRDPVVVRGRGAQDAREPWCRREPLACRAHVDHRGAATHVGGLDPRPVGCVRRPERGPAPAKPGMPDIERLAQEVYSEFPPE